MCRRPRETFKTRPIKAADFFPAKTICGQLEAMVSQLATASRKGRRWTF